MGYHHQPHDPILVCAVTGLPGAVLVFVSPVRGTRASMLSGIRARRQATSGSEPATQALLRGAPSFTSSAYEHAARRRSDTGATLMCAVYWPWQVLCIPPWLMTVPCRGRRPKRRERWKSTPRGGRAVRDFSSCLIRLLKKELTEYILNIFRLWSSTIVAEEGPTTSRF